MKEWLRAAFEPQVVQRGILYSVIVGPILIAINQGDAIAAGAVDRAEVIKMGLTLLVPYLVSTFSSVGAMRGGRDG